MKKITLVILGIIMIFTLTGCSEKTTITTKDFVTHAHEYKYSPYDVLEQYKYNSNITEATLVQGREGWTIEFYVLKDADSADSMFLTSKSKFEKDKSNTSTQLSTSGTNFDTYTLETNNTYKYLSRVDNTLLYIDENEEYKDEILEFIEEFNY